MRNRALLAASVLTLILAAALPATLAAETYQVDPTHSSVHFRVRHVSASIFQGRFNDVSGSLTFDEADPSKSSITVEVKAGSVDTRTERLNGHIMSPDFLNAKQFPVITFKSTGWKKTGDNKYEVTGQFTLRGITKDLTVEVEHIGTSNMMGPRIGFSTSFTINRRDFEVNYGTDEAVGDQVTLLIEIEGVVPKEG
jgi:polyisoprenoid-binding protein YceI